MRPRLKVMLAATTALVWGGSVAGMAIEQKSPASATAARKLATLSLPDVRGRSQALQQWQGKLRIINLWATWCSPCRAEMSGFSRLQEKYAAKNVQFVGIALDTPEQVAEHLAWHPVRYPSLIGSTALLPLFAELGNVGGSVPYTIILGRNGQLLQTHTGYWAESALESTLLKLINLTEKSPAS
jgi:thiol-disulfide isomerase/thioredoxin